MLFLNIYRPEQKQQRGEEYRATHIVLIGDDQLTKSKELSSYLAAEKDKSKVPPVLKSEWMIDSVSMGLLIDVLSNKDNLAKYQVDLSKFKH